MVLRSGLVLITGGALAGIIISLALTRLIASQIWGVSATDPWTFSAVVLVIFVAGLAACLLPARRATQVNPLRVTLRSFACLGVLSLSEANRPTSAAATQQHSVGPGERVRVSIAPLVDCVSLKRVVVPARRKRSGSVAEHGADPAEKTVYWSPRSLNL